MKTRQRQRLKENDLAATIVRAREYFEPRAKQFGTVAIILGAVVVAIFGISVMQQRANAGGEALLGDAMVALSAPVVPISAEAAPGQVPAAATLGAEGSFSTEAAKLNVALPKLQAAADAFPDSDAGITARYHLAGALAALGRHDEAITAFEEVVLKSGDSLYGRMAQMGKADTEAKAGRLDAAIVSWKALADMNDVTLPKDAILMELARAYAAHGNQEEARRTFTQIVDEHPTSPYSAEARAELDAPQG